MSVHVAVDIGASSGRVIVAEYEEKSIVLKMALVKQMGMTDGILMTYLTIF